MFKQSTIDAVNDLDLVDVISKYVPIKKQGANYIGKSPFSDEKTGSFVVSPAKNMWKCFSSGKGGTSAIKFVMEKNALTFPEAINELATTFGIAIEHDHDKGTENIEKSIKRNEIIEINCIAQAFYQNQLFNNENGRISFNENLDDSVIKQAKRASDEQLEQFGIGYASNQYDALKNHLLTKGISIPQMLESKLITKRETEAGIKYNDFFRNRIIFPIYDQNKRLVGFSGRAVEWQKGDKFPKMMNSPETMVFNKSKSLLGIHIATKYFRDTETVIKCEGNNDVTSLHEVGLHNSVATLGSALTEQHVTIFKRYGKNVLLAVDNDPAGIKKIQKDVELIISNGLTVELWISDVENQDPDDFVKTYKQQHKKINFDEFAEAFNALKSDAIEWLADYFFENADTIVKKTAAQSKLSGILAKMTDAQLRNNYVKSFAKKFGLEKQTVEDHISVENASRKAKEIEKNESNGYKLPTYLSDEQVKEFSNWRFYADFKTNKIGYYFPNGDAFEQVSNCILRPIFQVLNFSDSKRIVELKSAHNNKEISMLLELPNAAFVSQTELEKVLSNYGGFYFHGSKKNYQKLKAKLFSEFVPCQEIRTLGWQREGFFAFANGIVDGGFKQINKYGIAIHGEKQYFLPAFSEIYASLQPEDDVYENDRQFVYRPSSISFQQWAARFYDVYKDNENGMFAIAHLIAALFSDFIYQRNNNSFPILFGFGMPKTGKSTMGRSLAKVFKKDASEFNLNQGTPIALTRRLSRTRNGLEHLDEYQNDLDEKRFQMLKGLFDRTGHEKGVMSNDNKTTTTKINSAAYISGQYYPSRDGNSLVTRCVILPFEKKSQDFSQKEIESFLKLKQYEDEGLSNIIIECLKYRSLIEEKFLDTIFEIGSQMRDELRSSDADGRVMQNLIVYCAIVKLIGEQLGLPFSYEKFYNESKEVVLRQSAIIADSDQLSEFFKMLQFLILEYKLTPGEDFKIEEIEALNVRNGSKGTSVVQFDKPTKVLHLNFSKTYPLYLQYYRLQRSENGLPEVTIKSYMKSHKAFIGTPPAMRFAKQQTTAYSFLLERLPVNLDISTKPNFPENLTVTENETGNYNTPGVTRNSWPNETKDEELPF